MTSQVSLPPASLAPRTDAEADRRSCVRLLAQTSRTFTLSIEALPDSLRDAVRTAYLLCRLVDTIEDEADLLAADRERLFDAFDRLVANEEVDPWTFEWEAIRARLGGGGPESKLCRSAGVVFRQFRALPAGQQQAIAPAVLEMSAGMRHYAALAESAGRLRLADLDDLEHYCYFVAGTVGQLLTNLFEQTVPALDDDTRAALRARAVPFGLGLQLVNIVKDVASDHARGVCYLPQNLAREAGVSLDDLLEPGQRAAGMRLVAAVCERARRHLRQALEYTTLWPLPDGAPVRLFCAVPLALALATLDEVERSEATLRAGQTPKISHEALAHIMTEAPSAVTDGDRLIALFEDCQQESGGGFDGSTS